MNVDAFASVVLLVLLVVLIMVCWRETVTAYARQVLFEKRDALFDMAASGRLSFESEAYRTIRNSLEANIRFAHELTLTQLIFITAFGRRFATGRRVSEVAATIDSLPDDETKAEVAKLVDESQRTLVAMMVFKSPLLMVLALLAGLVALCVTGVRRGLEDAEKHIGQVVQIEAESVPSYIHVRR